MKCPKCPSSLEKSTYHTFEVEKCPKGHGMWFEPHELDAVEDTVFPEDEHKNTLITNVEDTHETCPHCDQTLKKCNYRWEELELEYCPEEHGFWLDAGEEKRIVKHMKDYADQLDRSIKAEGEWENRLARLQSPGFIDTIKDLLN